MKYFIETLKYRNETLFVFGMVCFVLAALCAVLIPMTKTQLAGVNIWFKPLKFALSIGIFSWTMGWYADYLQRPTVTMVYSWAVILLLGFEIVYIMVQAARGQQSHFNVRTPWYSFLYFLMASSAAVVAVWTGYLGLLFFQSDLGASGGGSLPDYYIWSIRLGIFWFMIFALEGFVMGSRMAHTIGGPDGGPGLPLVNWSTKYGDPRIAHFIGMHALQVLPLLSYYILKNVKATLFVGVLYGVLACFTLLQALAGKPLIKS